MPANPFSARMTAGKAAARDFCVKFPGTGLHSIAAGMSIPNSAGPLSFDPSRSNE
jgi:hypothetical protein